MSAPKEEVITFTDENVDEATRERWRRQDVRSRPRRLHVRIDVEIVTPGDEFVSKPMAEYLQNLISQRWFVNGCYESGRKEWYPMPEGGDCVFRFTFANGYGPNWFWRAWNHLQGGMEPWSVRVAKLIAWWRL